MALVGRAVQPFQRLGMLACAAMAQRQRHADIELRLRIALLGGQQKPVVGAGRVGPATLALKVQHAQVELGQRVTLVGCKLVPLARQREVLRNVLP